MALRAGRREPRAHWFLLLLLLGLLLLLAELSLYGFVQQVGGEGVARPPRVGTIPGSSPRH